MKVLIVGSAGQLQRALVHQLEARGRAFSLVDLALPPESILEYAGEDSAVVVEVASLEALLQYDFHAWPDERFQALLAVCGSRDLPMVFASHACVFSGGEKRRPREADVPRPRTDVGKILHARENALTEAVSRRLILRTGPVFSDCGSNPLTDLLSAFRAGGEVAVSDRGRVAPTPASDLARVLSAAVDQLACGAECWDVYHYHSGDAATCYEFAEVVLAGAAQYWDVGTDSVILRASGRASCGLPAPLLHCTRIRDHLGVQQRPWRLAVPALLRGIYEGERA